MKFIACVLLLSTGAIAQQCPQDVKTCPPSDGRTLNRDPTNNCNFPLCQGEKDCSSASTGNAENMLVCPSGSMRKRDGFNNCEFELCDDPRCEATDAQQCPAPLLHMYVARDPMQGSSGCAGFLDCPGAGAGNNCPQDVKTCPDGSTLNRNPTNNCNFPLCSGEKDCSSASTGSAENTLMCPSGSMRKRDGFNNCEFELCDDPRCEMTDVQQCPAPFLHMYVARDPMQGSSGCAGFLSCPAATSLGTTGNTPSNNCPQDVKTCPDGQMLNRNPTNNCNFPLCQGEKDCSSASTGSAENFLLCPSGRTRGRDGFNNCEFKQCDDPRCLMEDVQQCPSPNLHKYVARDPTIGPSGCDGFLPCATPTPYQYDNDVGSSGDGGDSDDSGSGGIGATIGLLASATIAAVLSMVM